MVADPGLAERIVANLIDNAVRHGGDGPVVLRTSAHDDRVELRVVDRGPGVARDTDLFTAFQHLGDHDSHGARAASARPHVPAGSPGRWAARSTPRRPPAAA